MIQWSQPAVQVDFIHSRCSVIESNDHCFKYACAGCRTAMLTVHLQYDRMTRPTSPWSDISLPLLYSSFLAEHKRLFSSAPFVSITLFLPKLFFDVVIFASSRRPRARCVSVHLLAPRARSPLCDVATRRSQELAHSAADKFFWREDEPTNRQRLQDWNHPRPGEVWFKKEPWTVWTSMGEWNVLLSHADCTGHVSNADLDVLLQNTHFLF